ncbi:hypothetical protein KY284_012676 [Solanum tuberosum]|nr:hypothetical protein KY284_012676 [Solanum tuberosum]
MSRIDRIFGNYEWMLHWGHVTTNYGLPFISDHAPMALQIQPPQRVRGVPFKFFNIWVEYCNFMGIVENTWSQKLAPDRMKDIWLKLKALGAKLRVLNNQEFKFIRAKIDETRTMLADIQTTMNTQSTEGLIQLEKDTLINLEKWSLLEENAIRQKSRVQWIKLGDSNTKYFSAVCKERSNMKQIMEITSLNGQKLHDPKKIKDEFVSFYKSLMGSSTSTLPAVNKYIMKTGPTLIHQQQLQLCAEVTKEEIYTALQLIGDDKAPGIDGYNAFFFKKTWPIIQSDIIAAITNFLNNSKLYKPVNCAIVSLVPKVSKPVTVKEFRPIACCSVIYKIISKILAGRLQSVINAIICETQVGFIPRRRISDNIILPHELVKAYNRKNISARCMIKIDLQKAYDSVEWVYLEQVMAELGFPHRFIKWVMTCVKTVSYSIVINGEHSSPFDAAKGLR